MEIFTDGFTGLQTPVAGRGSLAGFAGTSASVGSYRIALTGAQFISSTPPTGVPEPATMILLGTGLAGIAANRRRRRKTNED